MNISHMAGKAAISIFTTLTLTASIAQADGWGWGWGGSGGGDKARHDRDRDHHSADWFYTPHYVPRGHETRDLPRGILRIILGGLEYYYAEGLFYRAMADHYVVVPAPVGAVVTSMPPGCQPVIVEGTPYYLINGNTYVYTGVGYQVVPPPRVLVIQQPPPEVVVPVVTSVQAPAAPAPTPPPANDSTYTVNIPNSKGGYTAVTLTRSGNGFLGPQGEFYTEFPRIEQLKVMYGK